MAGKTTTYLLYHLNLQFKGRWRGYWTVGKITAYLPKSLKSTIQGWGEGVLDGREIYNLFPPITLIYNSRASGGCTRWWGDPQLICPIN